MHKATNQSKAVRAVPGVALAVLATGAFVAFALSREPVILRVGLAFTLASGAALIVTTRQT